MEPTICPDRSVAVRINSVGDKQRLGQSLGPPTLPKFIFRNSVIWGICSDSSSVRPTGVLKGGTALMAGLNLSAVDRKARPCQK